MMVILTFIHYNIFLMEKKIIALLENNLRVIIPELGAFVIRQKEPRVVAFNEQLNSDDGILKEYIQKTENVEPEIAEQLLSDYLNYIRKMLDSGNDYVFEGLGVLRKETGKMIFIPENELTVMKEVEDKQPEVVVRESATKVKEIFMEINDHEKSPENRLKIPFSPQQVAKWAVIILLANIAVFAAFSFKDRISDRLRPKDAQGFSQSVLDQLADSVKSAVADTSLMISEQQDFIEESDNENVRYYIVAGCFRDEMNANDLVKALQKSGFKAEKFGKIGELYAVSFSSYDDKEDAAKELARIREQSHPDAWMAQF